MILNVVLLCFAQILSWSFNPKVWLGSPSPHISSFPAVPQRLELDLHPPQQKKTASFQGPGHVLQRLPTPHTRHSVEQRSEGGKCAAGGDGERPGGEVILLGLVYNGK